MEETYLEPMAEVPFDDQTQVQTEATDKAFTKPLTTTLPGYTEPKAEEEQPAEEAPSPEKQLDFYNEIVEKLGPRAKFKKLTKPEELTSDLMDEAKSAYTENVNSNMKMFGYTGEPFKDINSIDWSAVDQIQDKYNTEMANKSLREIKAKYKSLSNVPEFTSQEDASKRLKDVNKKVQDLNAQEDVFKWNNRAKEINSKFGISIPIIKSSSELPSARIKSQKIIDAYGKVQQKVNLLEFPASPLASQPGGVRGDIQAPNLVQEQTSANREKRIKELQEESKKMYMQQRADTEFLPKLASIGVSPQSRELITGERLTIGGPVKYVMNPDEKTLEEAYYRTATETIGYDIKNIDKNINSIAQQIQTATPEQYEVLAQKRNDLIRGRKILLNKQQDFVSKRYDIRSGDDRGNALGAFAVRLFGTGAEMLAGLSEFTKSFEKLERNLLGNNTADKEIEEANKSAHNFAKKVVKGGEMFFNTTSENIEKHHQAAGFLGGMVPYVLGGYAGAEATEAMMFFQSFDSNYEKYKDLPSNQSFVLNSLQSFTNAWLMGKAMKVTKGEGVINGFITQALESMPKPIKLSALAPALQKTLGYVESSAVGAVSGAASFAAINPIVVTNESLIDNINNLISKNKVDVLDFGRTLVKAGESIPRGFEDGFILGSITAPINKYIKGTMDMDAFKYAMYLTDDANMNISVNRIKQAVAENKMSKTEAQSVIENMQKIRNKILELPANMSISDKFESFKKLNEIEQLEHESSKLSEVFKKPFLDKIERIKKDLQDLSMKQDQSYQHEKEGATSFLRKRNVMGMKLSSVSMFPERDVTIEGPLTQEQIDNFEKNNQDLLAGNEDILSIDTWKDKDGKTRIGISAMASHADAKELGRLNELENVYDLENNREVPTGAIRSAETEKKSEVDRIKAIREFSGRTKASEADFKPISLEEASVRLGENNPVIRAAKNGMVAVSKLLNKSNINIRFHDTNASMQHVLNTTRAAHKDAKTTKGNFSYDRNEKGGWNINIDINLANKADAATIRHELTHAVLLHAFGENPAMFQTMKDAFRKYGNMFSDKELIKFSDMYETAQSAEEYLAELSAIKNKIKPGTLARIAEFINDISKKFLGDEFVPFKNVNDANDIIRYFGSLAEAVRTGKPVEIREQKTAEEKKPIAEGEKTTTETEQPKDRIKSKQALGGKFSAELMKEEDLEELKNEGYLRNGISILDLDGETVIAMWPDNKMVGDLYFGEGKNKRKVLEGNGGIRFSAKFNKDGTFWASSDRGSAALVKVINELFDKNGGRPVKVVVFKGTDTKVLSSRDGMAAAMDIMSAIAENGDVPLSLFKKALSSATENELLPNGKKRFPANQSSAEMHKQIKDFFLTADDETFKKRAEIAKKIIASISKDKSFNHEKVATDLGMSLGKSGKIVVADLIERLGNVQEEGFLENVKKGRPYAYIEIPSKLKIERDKKHISYPATMKTVDGKRVTISMLEDNSLNLSDIKTLSGKPLSELESKEARGAIGNAQRGFNVIKIEAKSKQQLITEKKMLKQMTEDEDGNFLFYHYSPSKITGGIDPRFFGRNLKTGRDERPGIGISMYYTRPDYRDVGGNYGYVVRIPKDKVYPFNADPLNLYDKAEAAFQKMYPGQAFDANKQVAFIAQEASKLGYKMTVAKWGDNLRAQTTDKLKPEWYEKPHPEYRNSPVYNPKLEDYKANENKPKSKQQIDAYHGTPHDFDKFSTQYMGTGEGAQAFGWGMYFTDVKDIAKKYAEKLSKETWSYDNKNISSETLEYLFTADEPSLDIEWSEDRIKELSKIAIDKIKKIYIPDYKDIAKTSWSEKQRKEMPAKIKEANNSIKELKDIINSKNISKKVDKNLYDVTLHKGKTPDQYTYLEWDKKPDKQQVGKLLSKLTQDQLDRGFYYGLSPDATNQNLYKGLSRALGGDKAASLFLLENGIDGIKYPAESISRGTTSETARGFNYVVFDENAVTIEAKSKQRLQPGDKTNIQGIDVTIPDKKEQDVLRAERTEKKYFDKEVESMKPSSLSKEELKAILDRDDIAILTGTNPDGNPIDDNTNKLLNEKAEEWLQENNYKYYKVTGKYDQTESSFLVEGMTGAKALEFAKEFKQDSVAHSEGLIYSNDTIQKRDVKDDAFDIDVTGPGANYVSAIKTNDGNVLGFKIGIDFNERVEYEPKSKQRIDFLEIARALESVKTPTLLDKAAKILGATKFSNSRRGRAEGDIEIERQQEINDIVNVSPTSRITIKGNEIIFKDGNSLYDKLISEGFTAKEAFGIIDSIQDFIPNESKDFYPNKFKDENVEDISSMIREESFKRYINAELNKDSYRRKIAEARERINQLKDGEFVFTNKSIAFIKKALNEFENGDVFIFTDKQLADLGISKTNTKPILYSADIAKAYIQAKKDGSNPELVMAVEDAIGEPKSKQQLTEEGEKFMNDMERFFKNNERRGTKEDIVERAIADAEKKWPKWIRENQEEYNARVIQFKESKDIKIPKAPSQERISGQKPAMVTVNEMAALKDKIMAQVKAARDAKKEAVNASEELASILRGNEDFFTKKDYQKILEISAKVHDAKSLESAFDKIIEIMKKSKASDIKEGSEWQRIKDDVRLIYEAVKETKKKAVDAAQEIASIVKGKTDFFTRKDYEKILEITAKVNDENSLNKAFDKIVEIMNSSKALDIKEMSEWQKTKDDIRLIYDAAKETENAEKNFKRGISDKIKSMVGSGAISANQSFAILRRMAWLNPKNGESVEKFYKWADRIFSDADYANRLRTASDLRYSIKKSAKDKNLADMLRSLSTRFSRLSPSEVTDIDEYNKIAARLKDAVKPGAIIRTKKGDIVDRSKVATKVKPIEEYIKSQSQAIEQEKEKSEPKDDADKVSFQKNKIKEMEASVRELLETGKSPVDGEDVNLSSKDKIMLRELMGIETNDSKKLKRIAEAMDHLLVNGDMGKIPNIVLQNRVDVKAEKGIKVLQKATSGGVKRLMVEGLLSKIRGTMWKSFMPDKRKRYARDWEYLLNNSVRQIDLMLRQLDGMPVFDSTFRDLASGYANYKSKLGNMDASKAWKKMISAYHGDVKRAVQSNYKITMYLRQLEHESNPGINNVRPAIEYYDKTIESRNNGLNNTSKEEFKSVMKDFIKKDADGNRYIDKDALYDSMNQAEKTAIASIQDLYKRLLPYAKEVANIRGTFFDPIANYSHINANDVNSPDYNVMASELDNFMNGIVSTRAGQLESRTGEAVSISLDPFATANKAIRDVMLDYYMTNPIKTIRKITEGFKESTLEGTDEDMFAQAFNEMSETLVKKVALRSYLEDSIVDKAIEIAQKRHIEYQLANPTKAAAEVASNMSYISLRLPVEFATGAQKYSKFILGADGSKILENVNSYSTDRLYPHGFSGKFIDPSAHDLSVSDTQNIPSEIERARNMVYYKTLLSFQKRSKAVSETMLTSPDVSLAIPTWFGSMALKFKDITGKEIDFDKISANDFDYIEQNRKAIEEARNVADKNVADAFSTKNPFLVAPRLSNVENRAKVMHMMNNYLSNFSRGEFEVVREAIVQAVHNGHMSKVDAAKTLAAAIARAGTYKAVKNMSEAALTALGAYMYSLFNSNKEDDELTRMLRLAKNDQEAAQMEANYFVNDNPKIPGIDPTVTLNDYLTTSDKFAKEKIKSQSRPTNTFAEDFAKGVVQSGVQFLLNRNFGSLQNNMITAPLFEEFANKPIKGKDYDRYRDAILYSELPPTTSNKYEALGRMFEKTAGPIGTPAAWVIGKVNEQAKKIQRIKEIDEALSDIESGVETEYWRSSDKDRLLKERAALSKPITKKELVYDISTSVISATGAFPFMKNINKVVNRAITDNIIKTTDWDKLIQRYEEMKTAGPYKYIESSGRNKSPQKSVDYEMEQQGYLKTDKGWSR